MKLSKISQKLGGKLHGDDIEIEKLGSLDTDCINAIVYVEKKKFLKKALSLEPAALLIGANLDVEEKPHIEVEDPKFAFVKLLEIFSPKVKEYSGIDKKTYISKNALLGKDVIIMPGAVVLDDAEIDDKCIIYPGCVIEQEAKIGSSTMLYSGVIVKERCIIGNDCIIHSGAVIGSDGFGYFEKNGQNIKIPQIGDVKIGNRVEIGANCCIDRATIGTTEIEDDTKLDNMVHIAHNVRIGKGCFIAALAGISGSVNIGNRVAIMGQVGVSDHLSIPDGTIILGKSGIHNDIKKPDIYIGTPARQVREHHRIHSSLKYLPELLKRVAALEEKSNGDDS